MASKEDILDDEYRELGNAIFQEEKRRIHFMLMEVKWRNHLVQPIY